VQLTALYVSNNQLQSLPREIGQLVQLTALYVSFNQLQSLPREIGQLVQLTALYVFFNRLQSLPATLARLQRSCTIIAEGNHLTLRAIQAFQQEIAIQQATNATLGPRFLFSIYDPRAGTGSRG